MTFFCTKFNTFISVLINVQYMYVPLLSIHSFGYEEHFWVSAHPHFLMFSLMPGIILTRSEMQFSPTECWPTDWNLASLPQVVKTFLNFSLYICVYRFSHALFIIYVHMTCYMFMYVYVWHFSDFPLYQVNILISLLNVDLPWFKPDIFNNPFSALCFYMFSCFHY